ncbi:MAG: hypothetical protein HQL75_10880 [Magnetococcales bacterium]|nr:hypothetical protein [Magnetococcales bacterium]
MAGTREGMADLEEGRKEGLNAADFPLAQGMSLENEAINPLWCSVRA